MCSLFFKVWPVRCRFMSDTHAAICTNALRSTRDRLLETTWGIIAWTCTRTNITRSFNILRKCKNKLDCLILKCFLFRTWNQRPTISDSICVKLFVQIITHFNTPRVFTFPWLFRLFIGMLFYILLQLENDLKEVETSFVFIAFFTKLWVNDGPSIMY